MSAEDRTRVEHLRSILEEADRVRRDSERMRNQLDRTMKQPFWPERRRSVRVPPSSDDMKGSGDAA